MYVKIVVVSLLILLAQHVIRLVYNLDLHVHVYKHCPGPCQQVPGVEYGSEDVHTLSNGLTFISSGFRLQSVSPVVEKYFKDNNIRGRIFLFDMKNPNKGVEELKLTSTKQFNRDTFYPHGISVWEDKQKGKVFLFVVNHETPGKDRIEKFEFNPASKSLKHVSVYTGSETIRVVNDVQATSENTFYFTNFVTKASQFGIAFEHLAMLAWGDVVYFDGIEYRIVADGLMMSNGIAMSNDGKYVHVATFGSKEFRTYDRLPDSSLKLREIYPLYSAADNIVVDPVTEDLYIGSHPIMYKLLSHQDDLKNTAPSQVLHVKLKDGNVSSMTELFVDDGDLISGSSVATIFNNQMLVGSISHKLVHCSVKVPLE